VEDFRFTSVKFLDLLGSVSGVGKNDIRSLRGNFIPVAEVARYRVSEFDKRLREKRSQPLLRFPGIAKGSMEVGDVLPTFILDPFCPAG